MKSILEYIQKKHIANNYADYVDLDLPSGTLWAKTNVGATCDIKPESWYGLYFAWGETKGYKASDGHEFNINNYQLANNTDMRKYNVKDKLKQLSLEDDAANKYSGGVLRMPTIDELKELYTNTNYEWVMDYNGIKNLSGIIFTSKYNKNKHIFIPSAGCCVDNNMSSGYALYVWSSSCDDCCVGNALYINGNYDEVIPSEITRTYGFSVRGVLNK